MITFLYIFVYTYTCNDMRSVMLQINEYGDGVVVEIPSVFQKLETSQDFYGHRCDPNLTVTQQ